MLERGRAARRDERNRKLGAGDARHRVAQRQLDFASKAAGLSIDKRDSVPAVFGQVALRIADDEHVGKEHETHGPEVTTIDMPLESLGCVVVLPPDHLSEGHDGDVSAPPVLQELGVVSGPVVIDNVRRLAVFAHNDIRRISERPSI